MHYPVPALLLSLSLAISAPVAAQTQTQLAPVAAADSATLIPRTVEVRPDTDRAAVEVGGASMTGLRAGVHARTAAPVHAMAADAHANLGQSRAMMVVGVAGIIVGAIVGGTPGTVIMVGGALVGLKGLYDYLQ